VLAPRRAKPAPLFYAQFLISIPLFILTEANLSILGLGVMEPMPSWGNLMRGLEDFSVALGKSLEAGSPGPFVIVVMCFQLFFRHRRSAVIRRVSVVLSLSDCFCCPAFVAAQLPASPVENSIFCLHGNQNV